MQYANPTPPPTNKQVLAALRIVADYMAKEPKLPVDLKQSFQEIQTYFVQSAEGRAEDRL